MNVNELIVERGSRAIYSNEMIVCGSGNCLDADVLIEFLTPLLTEMKSRGIRLVTSDQSGIDYHIRKLAESMGIKPYIFSFSSVSNRFMDRETAICKIILMMDSFYKSGYRMVYIEGRSINPDEISAYNNDVLIVTESEGGVDFKKTQKSRPEPAKKTSRRSNGISGNTFYGGPQPIEATPVAVNDDGYYIFNTIVNQEMERRTLNNELPY